MYSLESKGYVQADTHPGKVVTENAEVVTLLLMKTAASVILTDRKAEG